MASNAMLTFAVPGQGPATSAQLASLRGVGSTHLRVTDAVAAPAAAIAADGRGLTSSVVMSLTVCGCMAAAAFARRGRRTGNKRAAKQAQVTLQAYSAADRQTYEGAPIGPPPDLPSLLLKNRIVFLGTPITSEVTELIIAQLLYLNYESADKPVTMYINSTGSTIKNNTRYVGESKVGMETDAFAIADCMRYIKPAVSTICIGQGLGSAAMLLGLGSKGKRFALPNATIMLSEPREPPARGPRQASDIKILAREVLNNRGTMGQMLATATGKTPEQIVSETNRCKYMSPEEAVEYGLIDKVLTPDKLKQKTGQDLPSFVDSL
eukprot:TRINITY_DN111969_c0_g1_i1.p1 TRINITY_DN111969_c0_g1~~TRINITY_DN111969_c0_g1_i1.p1  ORF type:complete len:323 (+),score=86.56 TRINITY_DN111969_c0_g1_i1:58-1026(+)